MTKVNITRQGLFGSRETLDDAQEYMMDIIGAMPYKILSSLFLKVPCVLEYIHNIPSTPIYSPIFLLICSNSSNF